MTLRTFDPKKTQVIFGPVIFSGFAEDSMVSIEPEEQLYDAVVGMDGETQRIAKNNRNYTAKIKLLATSPSHKQMLALVLAGGILQNDTYPFTLRSQATSEQFSSPAAFVLKDPQVEMSGAGDAREWTIYLTDVQILPL